MIGVAGRLSARVERRRGLENGDGLLQLGVLPLQLPDLPRRGGRRPVDLAGLDSLLGAIGRAGLPVELHVDGKPFPLPRGIDLSAYRIVQEGLTNALKHAHASDADVIVRYRPDELEIEVRDNGKGSSQSDGLGHGLVGIRERVKIYRGEMTATTAPEGGFVLSTRLPILDNEP
jgi:signal transduction histidine kinase